MSQWDGVLDTGTERASAEILRLKGGLENAAGIILETNRLHRAEIAEANRTIDRLKFELECSKNSLDRTHAEIDRMDSDTYCPYCTCTACNAQHPEEHYEAPK